MRKGPGSFGESAKRSVIAGSGRGGVGRHEGGKEEQDDDGGQHGVV